MKKFNFTHEIVMIVKQFLARFVLKHDTISAYPTAFKIS